MFRPLIFNFWFIQALGVIALVFFVAAFQSRVRKHILIGQTISALFFIAHFYLLGAYVGGVMNVIIIGRNMVFYHKDKAWANHISWLYLTIAISVGSLLYFWQGWISIFPVMGVIMGTYAMWHNKPSDMRFYMLLSILSWIPYMIAVRSYSGLAMQVVIILFIAFGMYRLDRKHLHNS
jgi:hypothetical protein